MLVQGVHVYFGALDVVGVGAHAPCKFLKLAMSHVLVAYFFLEFKKLPCLLSLSYKTFCHVLLGLKNVRKGKSRYEPVHL